jgi:hypothetical protein
MMKARKILATFQRWSFSWQWQCTWLATLTPTRAPNSITILTRMMRTSIGSFKKTTASKSNQTMTSVRSCRKTLLTLKKAAIGPRRVTRRDLINFSV